MSLGESDTRAKLIDPALHLRGWNEELIRREETAGTVDVSSGTPRRHGRGRIDYTLRVKVTTTAQPVAMALIEAKAEHLPPNHGLEQAKAYAACKRMNVPFVFSVKKRSWSRCRSRMWGEIASKAFGISTDRGASTRSRFTRLKAAPVRRAVPSNRAMSM